MATAPFRSIFRHIRTPAGPWKTTTILLLMVVCLIAGEAGWAYSSESAKPARASEPPKAASNAPRNPVHEKEKVRTDRYGDPLPDEAVARLGSLRLYHGDSVHRVTLSPDGKWVVSTGMDGNRMWNVVTGRELPLCEELRQAAVFATRDKLVGVVKQRDALHLWDIASGRKIGGLLPAAKVGELPLYIHFGVGFANGECPLGLSPDGRTLVICNIGLGGRSVLRFCDMVHSQVEEPIPLKQDDGVQTQMAFSDDSKTLVLQRVGKGYSKLHVWDVSRRKEQICSGSSIRDYGGKIIVSPDGKILATGSYPGKRIRLWDTRTLQELPPLLKQPDECLGTIAFSPDGKELAASNSTSTVRLWDLASRTEVQQFRGKGFQIYHMVFSSDGKYLAGGEGGDVTFWDTATGKFRHDLSHTNAINSVGFSPNGKRLVSGAGHPDNIVRIWDPLIGKETAQLRGHQEGISVVAYSPGGKLIASGGQDKTIRLWDAVTGREVHRLETEEGYVYAMAFSSDGKSIASGGGRYHRSVRIWDVATGRELRTIKIPGEIMLRMVFSPDGKMLATRGFPEADIRLWDVTKGEQIHRLAGPEANPPSLAFSPDGKTLAAGSNDGSVSLWDVLSGERRGELAIPHGRDSDGCVYSIAFSPDGHSLAAGYGFRSGHEEEGCMVRLWELSSGRVRFRYQRQRYLSHRRGISILAFSSDSTLLASGGDDRLIMIWDMTGQRTKHFPRKDRLQPEEGNALWNELADADAAKAYRAMQTLLAPGEQATALLKDRLRPAVALDERHIDRLIADLDIDEFAVRQKAMEELRKSGDDVVPALRKILAAKPSAEQRLRVKQLLYDIDTAPSSERLRGLRAVEVLEWAGTSDARQVLKTLAGGDAQSRLTREAKAALKRLAKRLTDKQ